MLVSETSCFHGKYYALARKTDNCHDFFVKLFSLLLAYALSLDLFRMYTDKEEHKNVLKSGERFKITD